MKLTKREALEICMELWKWLERNNTKHKKYKLYSDKRKERWPGWEKYGKMQYDCPCCEYCSHYPDGAVDCHKCPLKSLWGGDCTNDGSPYDLWYWDPRPKYARMIWKGCEAELARMDKRSLKARERRKRKS